MISCASYPNSSEEVRERINHSDQFDDGKFKNTHATNTGGLANAWPVVKDMLFNKSDRSVPKQQPVIKQLDENEFVPDRHPFQFSRLGHSTILMQIEGQNWLLDPVFSERVSPVQWVGPKRFHPVPTNVDALPKITGILISHNHYDHLDYGTVQKLKEKVEFFVVPLGIGNTLVDWDVDEKKIIELDWWENFSNKGVEVVSTPAQHFSGRGLFDGNKTLWSSYVIRTQNHKIFFSGDTGYFDGFKEIGEKYGPFDYAFMECGAYNELWRDIHMMPEDTMQAFKDLKGQVLIPIHNGTFDLSTHAWFDPMEKISALAKQESVSLFTPMIGELVNTENDDVLQLSQNWWTLNLESNLTSSLQDNQEHNSNTQAKADL